MWLQVNMAAMEVEEDKIDVVVQIKWKHGKKENYYEMLLINLSLQIQCLLFQIKLSEKMVDYVITFLIS